jgi:hypothetical protein
MNITLDEEQWESNPHHHLHSHCSVLCKVLEAVEKKMLTPKIGTGKRLTCGPSLIGKNHSAESFPQSIR